MIPVMKVSAQPLGLFHRDLLLLSEPLDVLFGREKKMHNISKSNCGK
jgi:hypothetical protein